jgi:hypothetical protein
MMQGIFRRALENLSNGLAATQRASTYTQIPAEDVTLNREDNTLSLTLPYQGQLYDFYERLTTFNGWLSSQPSTQRIPQEAQAPLSSYLASLMMPLQVSSPGNRAAMTSSILAYENLLAIYTNVIQDDRIGLNHSTSADRLARLRDLEEVLEENGVSSEEQHQLMRNAIHRLLTNDPPQPGTEAENPMEEYVYTILADLTGPIAEPAQPSVTAPVDIVLPTSHIPTNWIVTEGTGTDA